ncbi:hypothetical protein BWI97_22070 [Siphonobacter sp. BAB-5405]|uniref:hypothetical protein n=1 Tax=Siphonobacter sp. BAB-5405 TaxID=1864825 RepID=UPI000C809578|nr:hypothetical protein [Siphonobacter sp. BAB-5405]PMD90679.1 hypothetical protein BWI97_22070 [Siphonobacter sp. BAB-5405]
MTSAPVRVTSSRLYQFVASLLAATALLQLLLFPLEFLPHSLLEAYGSYFPHLLAGTVGVALLASLVFAWRWQTQEKSQHTTSDKRHARLQSIIRFWLALSISSYGFAKLLKTQFTTPEHVLDLPLQAVDGFSLTWYYFGYSYAFAVILGLFQIGGSILLLYRRTTLLGVFILLPVMVTIVLINAFFSISPGAFFNSAVFVLGLLFLIPPKMIQEVFASGVQLLSSVPSLGSWLKYGLRLVPVVIAFVALKALMALHPQEQTLRGTWKVEQLTRNGRIQYPTDWLTTPTAWSRIYFSGNDGCVFSPNLYRYDPSESFHGSYTFDSLKNTLSVSFYSSNETFQATVSDYTAKTIRLRGVMLQDTLDMQLVRVR